MALTSVNFIASTNWSESAPNTGFANTTQSDALSFVLSNINVAVWNQIYVTNLSITGSGNTDIDLTNVSSFVCESFAFTKVLSIMVLPQDHDITVGPGPSNGLQWFFSGPSAFVTVHTGGVLLWSDPSGATGTTVDSSHKILRFSNLSSSSATVIVQILGTDL